MSGKIKVAVVGCGVGRKHMQAFRALEDRYDLRAACDLDEGKAKTAAEEFGAATYATSLRETCRREDIDVVDLCTPASLHFEQILEVLDAGKHCICEKPAAASLRQLDAVALAERQSGKRVMPIFQKRFNLGVQQLKHLMDQGLAGTAYLATVETSWRRHASYYATPWRGKWASELGGVLLTHAIHAHDALTYLCGPVRSVFARTATRVNAVEVEDCASASLLMADGALASLSATLGSAEPLTRHRFCFSGFSAEMRMDAAKGAAGALRATGDTPELSQKIAESLSRFAPMPEGFEGQFALFHQALAGDGELPATLADARTSIELASALYCSAFRGEAVELPLAPGHPAYDGWLRLRQS